MDIRENITKNQILSIFILVLTFFSNQVLGSHRLDLLVIILPILLIGVGYCVTLFMKEKKSLLDFAKSPMFIWIMLMNIMLFIYGAIWKVVPEVYARSYHALNLMHLLIIVFVMFYERKNLKKLLPIVASIMIVAEMIFIIIYNWSAIWINLHGGDEWGDYIRVGKTFSAGVIETCICISLCMIPIVIELVAKKRAIYLIPLGCGIVVIGGTMQKSGILALLITAVVIAIGIADEKKTRIRNFVLVVVACVALLVISYAVPVLRVNIYERFSEMFYTLLYLDTSNAHSSTSKRLMYMIWAFKKAWDRPFVGHGLYAFGHKVVGFDRTETVFPDSHANYTELLYSCGLIGMVIYYWFPVKNLISTIKAKHSMTKLALLSAVLVMFFFDFCNISFYRNIIGYVVFSAVYLVISNQDGK